MADKDIVALTAATTPLTGAELVKVVQGGNSRKVSVTDVVAVSTGAMLKAVYDPNDDGIIAVAQGGSGSATAAGARTNFGLGTMAVQNAAAVAITGGSITGITDLAVADGGSGASDAAGARANFGLAIGTDVMAYSANLAGFAATTVANVQNRDNHTGTQLAATISDFSTAADLRIAAAVGVSVQAYDALLSSVSALSLTAGDIIYATGPDAVVRLPIGAAGQVLAVSGGAPAWDTSLVVGGLLATNNLSDVTNANTALGNLGIPSTASTFLRRNAGNTAYEARTPQQVLDQLVDLDFTTSLAGGAPVTVRSILEQRVTPEMFGCTVNAGTSQVTAFQAMLDSGATEIWLPAGTWRLDADVTCDHDITIRGPGTLDFSNGTGQLLIAGSATQISDLSANVTKSSRTLSFTSATGIAEFNLLCLFNPTDYSWSGHRNVYREGEFVRVYGVSGTTITIYGQTYDAYTAANMDVYRIDGVRVDIDEISIIPSTTSGKAPIHIDYGDGVRIGRIKGQAGVYALVQLKRCYDFVVDDTSVLNNSPVVGDEYGVSIANCQNGRVSGPALNATRHPIALGGFDDVNCVPCREIKIHNAIMTNAFDTGAGDAHGNCDHVTYHGCTARNMFVLGGRNMSWLDCTVIADKTTSGMAFNGSEIVGGIYRMENCLITSEGNGFAEAYIHMVALGPGNTPTGLQGLRDDLLWIAKNNTFDVVGGASAKLFHYDHRGNAKKATIVIDGVVVHRATALQAVGWIRDTVTTPMLSNGIIVDNVFAPSGTTLLLTQASLAGVPTRQMAQTIAADVECTSAATQATSATINFRYPYSKIPEAVGVAHRSVSGGAQSTWGGKGVASFVHAVTATGGRIAARSTTEVAFTSTENIRLSGTFGIREI